MQAAACGHLEILKWAHENGCPWDEWTYTNAARWRAQRVLALSYDYADVFACSAWLKRVRSLSDPARARSLSDPARARSLFYPARARSLSDPARTLKPGGATHVHAGCLEQTRRSCP